jgi:hypothetical protein
MILNNKYTSQWFLQRIKCTWWLLHNWLRLK